jgi:uncharacterized protein with von Willebrand factor type A (vWA) domain
MNPKPEELRRRFLPSTDPSAPTLETIFKRGPQVSHGPGPSEQMPASNSAEPAEPTGALSTQSSPQAEPHAEQVTDYGNWQVAVEKPKSVDQLGQAIAKLFEPAQRCKKQLAEIAHASNSIKQLTRSALELLEAAREFSRSYAETFELFRVDSRVSGRSRRTC